MKNDFVESNRTQWYPDSNVEPVDRTKQLWSANIMRFLLYGKKSEQATYNGMG